MDYRDKQIVILGLGISGLEAAQLLHANHARVTVLDGADNPALQERSRLLTALGITVKLGATALPTSDYAFAVLSPGFDPRSPLVCSLEDRQIPIFSELEIAARFMTCPIIAITGTNGKTTTTELVDAVLRAAGKKAVACGNIGKALSAVARENAALDFVVVEVSSFQLERIEQFRPHLGVHLNLTPDHLDRYATMRDYERAKAQIFKNQKAEDAAIVNANLNLPEFLPRKITINANGLSADYELRDGMLYAHGAAVFAQNESHLIGAHNAENLLAALAVADVLGLPRASTKAALCAYQALPHRCEKIRELNGVTYINDSKATNLDALEKALQAVTAPVILLAGGKDKGLEFDSLLPLLKTKVKAAVLIGQMTEKLFQCWQGVVPCLRAASLKEAVARAHDQARPGDTVLLSPGCSSFDMFKSFEDRGEHYRAAVQSLPFQKPTPTP